jgi:hypothetical protein
VKPSGILAVPLQSAPWVMGVYLAAAVGAWYTLRPDAPRPARGATTTRQPDPDTAEPSAPPAESVLAK